MLLSRTSEYAIQALIYLATQPPGQPVLSRDISQHLGMPAQYLAKILQVLAKHDVVSSLKGRGGGFTMRPEAMGMSILEVLQIVENRHFGEGCVLGLKKCNDSTACPVHYHWKPLKAEVMEMLGQQTLAGMAQAVNEGRYRLQILPVMQKAGS